MQVFGEALVMTMLVVGPPVFFLCGWFKSRAFWYRYEQHGGLTEYLRDCSPSWVAPLYAAWQRRRKQGVHL